MRWFKLLIIFLILCLFKTEGLVSSSETNLTSTELLIQRYFPENYETALKIAKCESRLNPNAVNYRDAKITGNPSWGLFQLNRKQFKGWNDPETNIKLARELYVRRGWQPWSCSRI